MTFKKSNPTTSDNETDAGNTKNNHNNTTGVEALKGYYYTGSQLNNQYNRTTRAIADYCCGPLKMFPGIWELIVEETEVTIDEPTEPDPNATLTKLQEIKYSKQMEQYLRDTKEYGQDKTRVFIIIRGQCSSVFRGQIEEHPEYKDIKRDDVIGLLTLIRNITYKSTSIHYEPYLIIKTFDILFHSKQPQENEQMVPSFLTKSNTLSMQ
jgi:hypothetical protein